MDQLTVLKQTFGHDQFRDGQQAVVDALLSGRDVLGVMPTGAGKSICYQLPALMMEGITLVVSPLISLMQDQVMALKSVGVAAAYLNSSLTPWQQGEAIRRAGLGAYRIIYVAPERLDVPSFVDFATKANIALIAVDEAHCVSQWGQDFRPSYLRIASFIQKLPKRPPLCALTATATQRVKEDIHQLLVLHHPYCVTTGYDRANLHFASVKPSNKMVALGRFIEQMGDVCGIVYCQTRKAVEEVTAVLQSDGYAATRYHAGLGDAERKKNQEDFRFDRAKIMVATNAFGMGIDKSDVRYVVHYNMPRDIESYYQEAGRAGRDGASAECLLLYSGQDVVTGKWLIEHNEENSELDPVQRAKRTKNDLERLKQMTYYATSTRCLRRVILQYFGEMDAKSHCDNCSVCDGDVFEMDTGTRRVLTKKQSRTLGEGARVRNSDPSMSPWETAMFDNLKILRGLIAKELGIPVYVVFFDSALHDMVKKRPVTKSDFAQISGVGAVKLERYAEVFLAVVRDGKEANEAFTMFLND